VQPLPLLVLAALVIEQKPPTHRLLSRRLGTTVRGTQAVLTRCTPSGRLWEKSRTGRTRNDREGWKLHGRFPHRTWRSLHQL
jgi:hypothetical protein